MKRVSVAQARDNLPGLIRRAEREPIEITRHGKGVVVLVPRREYRPSDREPLAVLLDRWREAPVDFDGEEFEGVRERTAPRDFSWD